MVATLKEKADQIISEARHALELLEAHRHAAWCALKWSVWARFDFWAQLNYPSDTVPVAEYLDSRLFELLESVSGLAIPKHSSAATRSWDCQLTVPVYTRRNWTFAHWVVRQPIKLGGLGLRSYAELCHPAFIGAVEMTFPRLHQGFCPLLTGSVGGPECFGNEAASEGRWRTFLSSRLKAATEFQQAWDFLKLEAQEASTFLGRDVEGPLTQDVESAGDGNTSGTTRNKILEEREKTMGLLLLAALEQHPNQNMRPVWSWPERDKLSSQWLLTLPGHDLSLSSEEFSECLATLLCLPSPATAPKVGERVGNRSVDIFGDVVLSASLPGDGFRKRHNTIKKRLTSLFQWANLEVECEVFNLFSAHIPQQGLSRIERGRKRQGLVPDFLIRMPVGERAGDNQDSKRVLAELKVLSSCPTRYQRNPRHTNKAVIRRAALLQGEYSKRAREMDQVYGGVEVGTMGPVLSKLLSFPPLQGWVFGAWGEASPDVHSLVHVLAMARLKHQRMLDGPQRKTQISDSAELAKITGQIRRTLSLEAVRSQARCLLDRLRDLGVGAAMAARRRNWAGFVDRRMAREQQAHLITLSQGRPTLGRGQFLLD